MSIKERWRKFKPLPEDIRERVANLSSLFERKGVLLAYLFGSLARQEEGEDVDLALLPGKNNFASLREKIYEALATERVDLVNLKIASPVLRFEVISDGILIYKGSDEIENAFELATLREYKDTAHMRRRQEKILKQRTQEWLSSQR